MHTLKQDGVLNRRQLIAAAGGAVVASQSPREAFAQTNFPASSTERKTAQPSTISWSGQRARSAGLYSPIPQ